MPFEFRTNELDWKAKIRANHLFAVLVTEAYVRGDRRCRQQLAYARQLGKPVYFLVQAGTVWTDVRKGEHVYTWATPEGLAQLCMAMERGEI